MNIISHSRFVVKPRREESHGRGGAQHRNEEELKKKKKKRQLNSMKLSKSEPKRSLIFVTRKMSDWVSSFYRL